MTATMSDAAAGEEALAGLLEERNGILRVEVQGVVKAPETTWNVELYPSEEEDSSMAEPAFGSLTLPAGDGNTYTEGSCELTELPDGMYDPVSYTHLDVYKRQGCRRSSTAGSTPEPCPLPSTTIPLRIRSCSMSSSRPSSCLLYTSI